MTTVRHMSKIQSMGKISAIKPVQTNALSTMIIGPNLPKERLPPQWKRGLL